MHVAPFELEWMGGVPERHFRKVRAGVDELPWGTLDPARYPKLLVDRARVSWTEAAYNEYTTAAAMCDLVHALLAARAPLDLVGMASDFVADEILHVELTSRVAMELGGGAPYALDFDRLFDRPDPALSPLQRASELVVRVCCVGESFSVPMLAGCLKSAKHPLTKAVLRRIVKDEAPHGRLGWLYLDWAEDRLDAAERARLARVALETVRAFEPYWRRLKSKVVRGRTTEGFLVAHVRELGWMEAQDYARTARAAMRREVVEPLAKRGIALPKDEVARILA